MFVIGTDGVLILGGFCDNAASGFALLKGMVVEEVMIGGRFVVVVTLGKTGIGNYKWVVNVMRRVVTGGSDKMAGVIPGCDPGICCAHWDDFG